MSDDILAPVITAIMARATAASGTAVFLDAVVLRELLAPLVKRNAWPRCDECGAELVEADPMQDKVCLLCEWKGKAGAARASWRESQRAAGMFAERYSTASAQLAVARAGAARLRNHLDHAIVLLAQCAYYRREQAKIHSLSACDCLACAGLDEALQKRTALEADPACTAIEKAANLNEREVAQLARERQTACFEADRFREAVEASLELIERLRARLQDALEADDDD